MKCIKLLLCIMVLTSAAYADVKVILYPKIKISSEALKVGDIGFVEGSSESAQTVRESIIDRKYYSDALIDRRELFEIIGEITNEPLIVVGSSVRLFPEDEKDKKEREIIVYNGDKVEVSVFRKGITLEFIGIIKTDAAVGDRVNVEIGKKGFLKGVVTPDGKVEVRI